MIKALIFDFDGTIVNSIDVKTDAFFKMYLKYGQRIAEKVVNYHLLNGGVSRYKKFKYYHKKFLGIDLSKKEINNLSSEFSQFVINKVIQAPYVPGIDNYIKNNYNKIDMFISTATPTYEIKEIMLKRKIDKYFKGIYGSPDSKSDHVKKIISNNNYAKNEIVFIGDSISDLEAAKKNSLRFIAVTDDTQFNKDGLCINNFNDFEQIINKLKI